MNKVIEMLNKVGDLIGEAFDTLEIKEVLDLQEKSDGDADQLCIGQYIICADEHGSYDVIEPLDEEGKEVAVLCFPGAIHVARYIVGRFV